ncbi:MrcB family domain-containing protein [Anabaena azotica]|uniref:MrcB family domain-containing protein n=1 Tax=Anabaena azotica TaxID=197653 RepID=UPI0039A43652
MLKEVIEDLLYQYPKVSREKFKNHEYPRYLKNEVPRLLNESLNLPDIYSIQASAGNGSWASIPWIAVFNKLITESVRFGFFLVYLYQADFSGVYLSLNQGTASLKERYGLGGAREVLREQAKVFRKIISIDTNITFYENIDLKLEAIPKETTARRLGQAYQAGNILATYYSQNNLLTSDKLVSDLLYFISIYEQLIENQPIESQESDPTVEDVWFEDLTKYKIHRRVERNQALCKKAKEIHGYICQACNFNFETRYGEIGKNYIEAHHIVPIATLEKTKVQLNPLTDFTVLCSNCHRMIHRIKPTPTLEEFKKIIKL